MSLYQVRPPKINDLIKITLPDQKLIVSTIVDIKGSTLFMKKSGVKLTWENGNWLLGDGLIPANVEFYISPKEYFNQL